MKKTTFIAIALLMGSFVFAQSKKGDFRLEKGSSLHRLYVSLARPVNGQDYGEAIANAVPGYKELAESYSIIPQKAIILPEEKLKRMEALAIKNTGSAASVAKLRNIFELSISNPTNARVLELAEALEKLDGVEYCSLMSAHPIQPPYDIMPVTPNREPLQLYLNASIGVNMDYAWNMGLNGQGMRIRDIEYGLNRDHEEFNERNVSHFIPLSPEITDDFGEHGTAVFGVMYADKGTYGVSGMAFGAQEMVLHTEFPVSGYNRLQAVVGAINNSDEGDIILYELQMTGALGDYCPAEYNNVVWTLTKSATDAGIIIVAAAGNGAEDLDHPLYESYRSRGNSGAIIVGAGSNNAMHSRLDFSTYGSRVDVHAWGQGVYTTGYGDVSQIGGDFNQSYTMFSGTSSATPIVASCVAVLQSYYHGLTGQYMTGPQMRELLIATGTPQGDASSGAHIGPLPDMEAAITEIANMLGTPSVGKATFAVYPNPVQDRLTLTPEGFSGNALTEVYNSLGQLVIKQNVDGAMQIDFSSLSTGIYTVKVSDGDKTAVKRVIKK
ncbi:S8 family peptidase [uncultured Flavobacterium sp.]|uniref:S8 family peptidase n=1 Tax=uncultured Flavobacterium sp. TaxID=165435 RepID=UPI0025FFA699|nr:S8 family peptidase [uncultured Flavobacterium sp.]